VTGLSCWQVRNLPRARTTENPIILTVWQDLPKISDATSLPIWCLACFTTFWRSLTLVVGAYVSGGCTESPHDRMPFLTNCGNRRNGLKKFRKNSTRFFPKCIPTSNRSRKASTKSQTKSPVLREKLKISDSDLAFDRFSQGMHLVVTILGFGTLDNPWRKTVGKLLPLDRRRELRENYERTLTRRSPRNQWIEEDRRRFDLGTWLRQKFASIDRSSENKPEDLFRKGMRN